jgi:hypothetical protein
MFGLFVYPQNIQIRIADTFCYPYRIAADIWISDYIHIRGYADLDISRMLPQSTRAPIAHSSALQLSKFNYQLLSLLSRTSYRITPMASMDKPQILLLCLSYRDFLDKVYSTLFSRLLEVAHIKHAKSASAMIYALASTTFKAIIIADEGLTERDTANQEVLARIKCYVENGGLAITGLHFTSFTPMDNFKAFFQAFGLPWEMATIAAVLSSSTRLLPCPGVLTARCCLGRIA